MQKTAILLGATGLTGGHLLDMLLSDKSYKKVVVFTRRPTKREHPKLEELVIDLLDLKSYQSLFHGEVVFCCIGTTKAKTPNKELYREIDYGIPVDAAELAMQNNIPSFIVISALGANEKSKIYYNRCKGEMEREVLAQGIPHTFILQPSLIVGDREEKRKGENFAKKILDTFNFIIPKKYKSIQGIDLAKAMLLISKQKYPNTIISSNEIRHILETNS